MSALFVMAGCEAGTEPFRPRPGPEARCLVGLCDRVRLDELGLDPFYQKVYEIGGVPVVASEHVSDEALLEAGEIVLQMLGDRTDILQALIAGNGRVGVMSVSEVTTDIPEHAFLAADEVIDWNERARGLGGTPQVPVTTVGEENLLCLAGDRNAGESILVHQFAHAIHLIGIDRIDEDFTEELRAAWQLALEEGLWASTFAAVNHEEYWAEGVQSWFDANQDPQAGLHNDVDTRVELETHDPRLHALIARYLPASDWRPTCR